MFSRNIMQKKKVKFVLPVVNPPTCCNNYFSDIIVIVIFLRVNLLKIEIEILNPPTTQLKIHTFTDLKVNLLVN